MLLLAGIGWFFTRSSVTQQGRFDLGDGLTIAYRTISEGGALGQERYEAFAEHGGEKLRIFEGINGQGFGIKRTGPRSIRIRFCNGTISYLAPIAAFATYDRTAVDAETDCSALERQE